MLQIQTKLVAKNDSRRTWLTLCFATILASPCALAWVPIPIKHLYRASVPVDAVEHRSDGSVLEDDVSTLLLRVSYDGRHFTGWSSANESLGQTSDPKVKQPPAKTTKRRRRKNEESDLPKGFVRSVRGVLQSNLAKLCGNIDPQLVVVEGCSRTDKGVHAAALVAQIHCQDPTTINTTQLLPLPKTPHDIAFCLNRMCTDIKITAVARVPDLKYPHLPFHPSTSVLSKTYCYTLALGPLRDPTSLRTTWHAGYSTEDESEVLLQRLQKATNLLIGCHDFRAFRGAPRSARDADRFVQQSTICTVEDITVTPIMTTWQGTTTLQIRITGDRFLYKMVRWMVGALVAVGLGDVDAETVHMALQDQHRPNGCWQCAPAHGLVLEDVKYPFPIDWEAASM